MPTSASAVVISDGVHNMLSGTFRDQRRILTHLRYRRTEEVCHADPTEVGL
jgi:hypothetical protein